MNQKEKNKINTPVTYNFLDDKIRVEYKDGLDSILFEDISSISTIKVKKKQWIFILLGIIGGIFINLLFNTEDGKYGSISIIIGLVLFFILKKEYDNVIIESKGGKLMVFTVGKDEGKSVVDEIEDNKRLRTSK